MAELGVFGVGVATADPELRFVGDNGNQVCTVNLAFNRSYQDKNKEWQKEACFVRVQAWGKKAERLNDNVKRGHPIFVSGYLKQETWEKDGQKRVAYSISLRDFQPCEKIVNTSGETQKETVPPSSTVPDIQDDGDMPF